MRVRQLGAAALAVLAVTGLSACRSNVGAAAVVNGRRIAESDVHKYVTPAGVDPSLKAQAETSGQVLVPTSIALNTIVQARVYELVLAHTPGGVPSNADLRAARDVAAQTLSGGQITSGAALQAAISSQLTKEGLKSDLLPLVVRSIDLEYALITRVKATSSADIAKAVAAQHVSVSVNPAYGRWSAADVSVLPPSGTDLPNFLTLQSPPVAPTTAS
ncbi:MAG TPA: hypothetical protein VGN35_09440 [Jatrophihabitantaceae bacterium]|nr:hypothetical protein [Jatrophihabitantaceae bacterium]